jgi:prophage maintenance system killer protein
MSPLEPWTRWIDVDRISKLHTKGLDNYGGLRSQPTKGCIESALGAAYTAEAYSMPEMDDETVISGLSFCGYLLFYIATKQCWSDGNKRAAWSSAMYVLSTMGLTVDVTDPEAIDFCYEIAKNNIKSGEEVVNWIADRLSELSV